MRQIDYDRDPADPSPLIFPIRVIKEELDRKKEWEKYIKLFGGNYAVFSQTDKVEIIEVKGGWKHGSDSTQPQ